MVNKWLPSLRFYGYICRSVKDSQLDGSQWELSFEVLRNTQYTQETDTISVTINNHDILPRNITFCLESSVD